ncbi:MAG: membrane protease subunit [Lentisphaeria bacterium]|nr:membrane protease subunit [Lentisphaeria bacterium]MBO5802914.1 membrane protease subunit [Lentisphaeria bacterium]
MNLSIKTLSVVAVIALLISMIFFGYPQYKVWQQRLAGQAELARAEQNRKIAIQEAEAKKESARALAEAEVIRAEGVAKANSIIGESLRGNESYLRYLWIQTLNDNPQNVIYVPTEAGLPILEAGKRQSCRTDDKTDDL